MIYEYNECRGNQHHWDAVGPIAGRRPRKIAFGTMITYRCVNCHGLKFEVVSRLTGDVLWRRYEPPKGYKAEWRSKAAYRADWLDEIDKKLLKDLETDPT